MLAKTQFTCAGMGTVRVVISSQWPLVAQSWLLSHTSDISEIPLEDKTTSQEALNSDGLHSNWNMENSSLLADLSCTWVKEKMINANYCCKQNWRTDRIDIQEDRRNKLFWHWWRNICACHTSIKFTLLLYFSHSYTSRNKRGFQLPGIFPALKYRHKSLPRPVQFSCRHVE